VYLAELLRKRPRLNKTHFSPDVLSWLADMEEVIEEIQAFDGWIDKPFYAKPPKKQVRLITAAFKIWVADKPTLVKAIESAASDANTVRGDVANQPSCCAASRAEFARCAVILDLRAGGPYSRWNIKKASCV